MINSFSSARSFSSKGVFRPSASKPGAKTSPRFGDISFLQAVETGAGLGAGVVLGKGLFLLGLGGIGVVLALGATVIGASADAVKKTFFSKNGFINTVARADYDDDLEDALILQNATAHK